MPYEPPSLTALLWPRADEEGERGRDRFGELAGGPPSLSLTTASWVAHLLVTPSSAVAEAGGVRVVLHGEVYERGDQAGAIAADWSRRGAAVAAELNGSFALLVVDEGRDSVSVVTDRLGSRRLFCSAVDGGTLLSSAFAPHRRVRRTPDPTGVMSYLVNGRAFAGRTVLDGVRQLERASIHRLTDGGLSATPYWHVRFDPSPAPEEELGRELTDRLATAVDRCLFDQPTPFLALSGGKDSRGIAAQLRWGAGVDDVQCFSFVRGRPRAECDEHVAAQLARALGYPHRLVQSYDGDLVTTVLDNAAAGEGNTNLVHEVAGWKAMAEQFAAAERPMVLTGDTALGWDDVTLRTSHDVLDALFIQDAAATPALRDVLPAPTFRDMAEGLEADRDAIWSRCADLDDLHDAADFLNIDQRLPYTILPWREAFTGRSATVRRPFLDNDLLDLVTVLPTELRRGKRLYRRALATRHPELAGVPFARDQNFRIDHPTEVPRHEAALRRLIDGQSSVVDDLVPPEVAHRLLAAAVRSAPPQWRGPARRAAKRVVPASLRTRVRSRLPEPLVLPVPPALLLVRLLILRAGLPS